MSQTCKKIFITTPIYYVNDVAHIGHAYTTIIGDTISRYSRLKGLDTLFLTGTDEHGQKIAQSAEAKGIEVQKYANEISGKFRTLWDYFDISYDKFIRTTDTKHKRGVQKAFQVMFDKGDIYKGDYEGHYCVSCETFFTQTQLIDGEGCPDCGKQTSVIKEESYFFRLSKYEDKLLKWYEDNEDCILPRAKKNEVSSFVKEGLRDLSITRTSFDWGVKLPKSFNDDKHVMYVWLDALLNYITALGYGGQEENMDFWPSHTQLVGKDILRFHAIYWPAFLMSLDLPLPTHIAAHGWWTRDGAKMSKSKGNVVDPKEVADAYGLDNFRYFMLREVPFGGDGDFSQKALIDRINGDLGNDLGNLLSRIIGMSGKYFDFSVDSIEVNKFYSKELKDTREILLKSEKLIYEMKLHRFLEELWRPLGIANKAIEEYKPWVLMKEAQEDKAMALVALVANILARVNILLSSVMPSVSQEIATALNYKIDTENYNKLINKDMLLKPFKLKKRDPLFPRVESPLLGVAEDEPKTKSEESQSKEDNLITIDQFFETSLKIGTVIEAKEVPKSKKLLILQVDIGSAKPKQILAGIKEFYSTKELLNTQVCVVANLKPTKLMGHLSEGMLLAAKDNNGLHLIRPDKPKEDGTLIK